MALIQAMMFSFLQHIGIDRGFGAEAVTGVLIALGFVNLIPSPLAAYLETRVSPRLVLAVGPILQALIVVAITQSSSFIGYAAPALFFAGVMIFTHTFAFGLLARLDPTARALAGTPAMLMIGGAIGPILGGALVKGFRLRQPRHRGHHRRRLRTHPVHPSACARPSARCGAGALNSKRQQ